MFDSERWVLSYELWVFSTKEQKDISFYETHSSKPRLSDVLVHRSFFRHFSFTVHLSLLIAPKPVSYVLMSNPFGEIGAICVSKNLRTLHAEVPTSHNSKLTTHCSLLTTQKSVVFASSAFHCLHLSKKKKKGFWTEWRKSKNRQPSYSQANTKPWKTLRKHTKKRLKCFLSFT